MTVCPPHHVVYPPPNGPLSVGVCKHCGAESVGRNSGDLRPSAIESADRDPSRAWRQWHMRDADRVREFRDG